MEPENLPEMLIVLSPVGVLIALSIYANRDRIKNNLRQIAGKNRA